jgi:DNA-binding PucR family transcriptional regulator
MRIEALLAPAAPRLRLLTGGDELDRVVSGVMTTDLRDPGRYLHGGELVLTGMVWRSAPEDSDRFVKVLADGGAVALAAGEAEVGPVPGDLVAACARHRMPLFAVPEDVAFAQVTEYVVRQISADRAADLAALVERHRQLVAAAGGGGLDAVLDLLGGDLDLDCWVLTPTGRVVAGPGERLTGPERQLLARTYLAARTRGVRPPVRTAPGARRFSLLPVPVEGDGETTPLAEWLLAVTGDMTEWTAKRRELAENLARLAGTERARRDEGGRLRARLADELVRLLERDAPEAEVRRALRAAEAVEGEEQVAGWLVVCAESPGLPVPALRAAVAEALTGLDPRALVEATDSGVMALLPGGGWADGSGGASGPGEAEADGSKGDAASAGPLGAGGAVGEERAVLAGEARRTAPARVAPLTVAQRLRAVLAPLEAGLGPGARLVVGVSAPAAGAGALRGALEEARHARGIAAARDARLSVAGPEELASHVLLLAAVPDEVWRAFRERLLGPVVAYDLAHQADLVATLEAFLRCDGSWTRCAAALHVHVNTLRYRIGRIEELTGRDLSRLADRVDFYLALRLA